MFAWKVRRGAATRIDLRTLAVGAALLAAVAVRGIAAGDEAAPKQVEYAFDGLYETWIAEVAADFDAARKKYDGKTVRLQGVIRSFRQMSRHPISVPTLNLDCEPDSRTEDATVARKYAQVGTICEMKTPPWTRTTLGLKATVRGKPFFSKEYGIVLLRDGELERENAEVKYPRIAANEIAGAVVRDRDAAKEKYDGLRCVVTGEVIENDRGVVTLRGSESYPLQCNYGGVPGAAFENLKPGDRVELLGTLSIYQDYVGLDDEVNYGYRP